uniref:Uncharacterized protein n=1 Tax=Dicranema revolutum TaxID=239144 RepID=A0A4D6WSX8_9FLOR|nr:hypothetical protein [Dicranema revolutum]
MHYINFYFSNKFIDVLQAFDILAFDIFGFTNVLAFFSMIIPNVFIRIVSIFILSWVCLRLLFFTTTYEDIIIYIAYLFQKNKNLLGNHIAFIIIISSQFLLVVTQKFFQLSTGVNLRIMDNINIIKFINFYYFTLIEILIFSNYYLNLITHTLYVREIKPIIFNFFDIIYTKSLT